MIPGADWWDEVEDTCVLEPDATPNEEDLAIIRRIRARRAKNE